jgi:hypothetical protein
MLYTVGRVAETVTEPLMAPFVGKPMPVQEFALLEDQVRIMFSPEATAVGLAERETVGAVGLGLKGTIWKSSKSANEGRHIPRDTDNAANQAQGDHQD